MMRWAVSARSYPARGGGRPAIIPPWPGPLIMDAATAASAAAAGPVRIEVSLGTSPGSRVSDSVPDYLSTVSQCAHAHSLSPLPGLALLS
jgi:hypothetical protein